MANARVTNVCQSNIPAAIATKLPDGEWLAGGDPYWRSRTNIHAKLCLHGREPNLELTFSKSRDEEGWAGATFPLRLCTSVEFKDGILYPFRARTLEQPLLKFWDKETMVEVPDVDLGRSQKLQYIALSLTGVPALKWEMRDLKGTTVGSEDLRKALGDAAAGDGKTEILIIFDPEERLAKIDWDVLRTFEARCGEIQDLKQKCAEAEKEKQKKARDVETAAQEAHTPAASAPTIPPVDSPLQPQDHTFPQAPRGMTAPGANRGRGAFAGGNMGSKPPSHNAQPSSRKRQKTASSQSPPAAASRAPLAPVDDSGTSQPSQQLGTRRMSERQQQARDEAIAETRNLLAMLEGDDELDVNGILCENLMLLKKAVREGKEKRAEK